MIRQLAHINLFTDDLQRMVDFYVGTLGMKVKFTLDNAQGKPFGYYFECGHASFIEVFDQKGAIAQWGGTVMALSGDTRFRHLCFEVTDLEEYCAALRKKGLEVSAITMGMDNSRQAWIHDPDGNSIELMEYTHRSLQLQ